MTGGVEVRCWRCRKLLGIFRSVSGVIVCPRCDAENRVELDEAA